MQVLTRAVGELFGSGAPLITLAVKQYDGTVGYAYLQLMWWNVGLHRVRWFVFVLPLTMSSMPFIPYKRTLVIQSAVCLARSVCRVSFWPLFQCLDVLIPCLSLFEKNIFFCAQIIVGKQQLLWRWSKVTHVKHFFRLVEGSSGFRMGVGVCCSNIWCYQMWHPYQYGIFKTKQRMMWPVCPFTVILGNMFFFVTINVILLSEYI